MAILLTGGAGFIGSHTALVLLEAGLDVVVYDNLCNASRESLVRVERLTGRSIPFFEGDIRDAARLDHVLANVSVEAVVHFAGLKAVGESTQQPLGYYDNNVNGTLTLCAALDRAGIRTLVFSSSATVYAESRDMPLSEEAPTGRPTNPYGSSKLMIEWILRDLQISDPRWSIALLRYFNPVGAHESGQIGEDPSGAPNNLLPYITQVGVGRLEALSVYGDDYDTRDGTGVRDYIHVMDLAAGHLAALKYLLDKEPGVRTWNLGTGRGYSVLEMIHAFEAVSGKPLPYRVAARRPGDLAECWADASRAKTDLGWQASHDLEDIMRDAWRWQSDNPSGYGR